MLVSVYTVVPVGWLFSRLKLPQEFTYFDRYT
jgi:hypothetical protein